jgi:hypothetical protein
MPVERIILFHAVGSDELELIKRSGWTQFPSRSREEPLFYPILTEEYATQVAREAYVEVDGVGWVTKCAVSTEFLRKYDVQEIGALYQREYWIPAAELADLNRHLASRTDRGFGGIAIAGLARSCRGMENWKWP